MENIPKWNGHLSAWSIDNEINAWKYISATVDKVLAAYPTTLEQDIQLLKEDDKNPVFDLNTRNCIIYRKNEKSILQFFKDVAKIVNKITQHKDRKGQLMNYTVFPKGSENYFRGAFLELLE